MRKFEKDPRFYELETIEEARQFRTSTSFLGSLWANKVTLLTGAVHQSTFLQELAASCEHLDSNVLPVAQTERKFSNGKVRFKGAHPDIDHLNSVASEVGNYLEPLFGKTMYMGIYNRQASDIQTLHTHPNETTASLPLGRKNWLSTVWKNEAGQLVEAKPNSLVIMDGTISHGSAPLDYPQLVLTISSPHKMFN